MSAVAEFIVESYLHYGKNPTEIMSTMKTLGFRIARAALSALIAYVLLCNQSYYNFNFFVFSLAVFGIGVMSEMYKVVKTLLIFLLIIIFLPEKDTFIQIVSRVF